ncbi:MAG TPA: hypothetical protein DEB09_05190 [Candidatus Magasanikbacteria bacterium]|nr:hypothetical protein [Candidatus Magasanikbacteria bacterium]
MKTDTKERIIGYIKQKNEVTANELAGFLGISAPALYKQLNKLIEDKVLSKSGKPPKVFYYLTPNVTEQAPGLLDQKLANFINENYLFVSPVGSLLEGVEGFNYWCGQNNLSVEKTVEEYEKTLQKYLSLKHGGLLDGRKKIQDTFKEVFLDEIYYLDFYSIERFGKTKLGALLLYAKQSQNKMLIRKIAELVRDKIVQLIKEKKIDAIGFVPPTAQRRVQLQKELEKMLMLNLPVINLVKATGEVAVQQKSLSKLEDRVENARRTIFVDDNRVYKNILLLDDAVGSGATLNETAKKIKDKKMCTGKVIGLALVGSFKGFDVISGV